MADNKAPTRESPSDSSPISFDKSLLSTKEAFVLTLVVGCIPLLLGVLYFLWRSQNRRQQNHPVGSESSLQSQDQGTQTEAVRDQDPLLNITTERSDQRLATPSPLVGHDMIDFNFEELRIATGNFASENKLGEGGFGGVYKGTLRTKEVVAIKKLNQLSDQGEREFYKEISILRSINHRNVVCLRGHCSSGTERLLVYEYISNNTLYHHLHGDGVPVLQWANRVKIARGCAKVLSYLHFDCAQGVIHGDIKSLNILVNESFEAKVSDYGLGQFFEDLEKGVSTRGVRGSPGYTDPNCLIQQRVTVNEDTFAFGVVLLELLTGRQAIFPVNTTTAEASTRTEALWYWAKPHLEELLENGNIKNLVDPRLEKNYNHKQFAKMAVCAAYCTAKPDKRPPMDLVLRSFADEMTVANLKKKMANGGLTLNERQDSK